MKKTEQKYNDLMPATIYLCFVSIIVFQRLSHIMKKLDQYTFSFLSFG